MHTRFERTLRTADLALEGRDVPRSSEPLLDDIDVGELDGVSIDTYRAWKRRTAATIRSPVERASTTRLGATRARYGLCSHAAGNACSSSATRSRSATR